MALSSSPRKVVPLAGGTDWQSAPKHLPTGPSVTKRVFYCGVVVENSENGRRLPQGVFSVVCGYTIPTHPTDVQDLVASLGEPLRLDSDNLLSSPTDMHMDSVPDHVSGPMRFLLLILCRAARFYNVVLRPQPRLLKNRRRIDLNARR
jgi:hypothetical protein